MASRCRYFSASTGKKFLMTISGAALFAFIVGPFIGEPADLPRAGRAESKYSAFSERNRRAFVDRSDRTSLIMVAIHIWTAASLTLENQSRTPAIAYAQKRVHRSLLRFAHDASVRNHYFVLPCLSPHAFHLFEDSPRVRPFHRRARAP